jgi:hypothetical protein
MPKPTIDDQYWFDLSKTLIDDSTKARNDAAAKLQTTITWFWTVYTAAITIGAALAAKKFPWYVFVLLSLPSVVLIVAYWMTVRAQMPADVQFDPRSPDDIQTAYNNGLKKKKKALSLALAFSLLAAVVLGAALVTASVAKEKVPPAPQPPSLPDFTAAPQSIGNAAFVRVTGTIPSDTARVVVTPVDPKSDKSIVVLAPVSAKGMLTSNVPVSAPLKKFTVSVAWTHSDKSTRMIAKSF